MTTPLQQAAQAMIDRWDSTDWKDTPHTADYIAELRKALDAEIAQSEPDCVARIVVFGKDWKLDYLSLPVGVHDLYARSFTYTQPQATTPAASEGYVLVPIEPTIEMLKAGRDTPCSAGPDDIEDDYRSIYKAMLAAAQGEKP